MSGTLHVISTPIGNIHDISLRALETLKGADLIACEDTRHTRKLLAHFDIPTSLTSFFIGNEKRKSGELVKKLKEGMTVALVTDSGTPGVSDPGFSLIRDAIRSGIRIEAVPGSSAVLAALVVSGAPMDEFTFLGFLPPKGAKRLERIRKVTDEGRTVV